MVSPEQIERLRYSMETNDFDTIPELYHEDMELRETDPGGGVHKGQQAYIAYFRQLFEHVEYLWTEVEEFLTSGDQVLAYTRGDLRDRATDTTMHVTMGIVFGFRDGKIALVEPFLDRARAYEVWRSKVASESDQHSVAPDLT